MLCLYIDTHTTYCPVITGVFMSEQRFNVVPGDHLTAYLLLGGNVQSQDLIKGSEQISSQQRKGKGGNSREVNRLRKTRQKIKQYFRG